MQLSPETAALEGDGQVRLNVAEKSIRSEMKGYFYQRLRSRHSFTSNRLCAFEF